MSKWQIFEINDVGKIANKKNWSSYILSDWRYQWHVNSTTRVKQRCAIAMSYFLFYQHRTVQVKLRREPHWRRLKTLGLVHSVEIWVDIKTLGYCHASSIWIGAGYHSSSTRRHILSSVQQWAGANGSSLWAFSFRIYYSVVVCSWPSKAHWRRLTFSSCVIFSEGFTVVLLVPCEKFMLELLLRLSCL